MGTRPDVVNSWSDEEVALHWWRLFRQRRDGNGAAEEALESELNAIRNDASGLKEKRKRLFDISWFMRCLAEPIARRGNIEDKVSLWVGGTSFGTLFADAETHGVSEVR